MTFVQCVGGSIDLHTHYHGLILDGVYADPEDTGTPRFFALSPPSDEEIARVTASVAKRVVGLAGKHVMRLGDRIEIEDVELRVGEQCASVQGFSLHAGVAVGGQDRARLERLCRYISSPRSPESDCSNSRMGGSHIGFASPGGTGRRMSFSSRQNYWKSWLFSCPGLAAMRFDTTGSSRRDRSGERR